MSIEKDLFALYEKYKDFDFENRIKKSLKQIQTTDTAKVLVFALDYTSLPS